MEALRSSRKETMLKRIAHQVSENLSRRRTGWGGAYYKIEPVEDRSAMHPREIAAGQRSFDSSTGELRLTARRALNHTFRSIEGSTSEVVDAAVRAVRLRNMRLIVRELNEL